MGKGGVWLRWPRGCEGCDVGDGLWVSVASSLHDGMASVVGGLVRD